MSINSIECMTKADDQFPETTEFVRTIQDHVINSNSYKKYILKGPNTNAAICRKCRAKSETIPRITGACLAQAQSVYTHRHSTVANIVHQELAIKCGLSKIPPMLYRTYEPQSVLGNSSYNCTMIGP